MQGKAPLRGAPSNSTPLNRTRDQGHCHCLHIMNPLLVLDKTDRSLEKLLVFRESPGQHTHHSQSSKVVTGLMLLLCKECQSGQLLSQFIALHSVVGNTIEGGMRKQEQEQNKNSVALKSFWEKCSGLSHSSLKTMGEGEMALGDLRELEEEMHILEHEQVGEKHK